MIMAITGLQLRTLVQDNKTLELSLREVQWPEPADDEVIVQIEAAPINPSDLALLLGPADVATARIEGNKTQPVVRMDIPAKAMHMLQSRIGQSLPVGNEASGKVVAAGNSDLAQSLLGKTVGMAGGEMFAQYRCVKAVTCLPLPDDVSAVEGASCFVNPMTAMAMVETMRAEGHTALVNTAAASNLGQMLNRLCQSEGIEIVNIVRKIEQQELLRNLGAKYICNSEAETYLSDLTKALAATGATLAFDATGGGRLASGILSCMESVAASQMTEYNRYGSDVYKQVYVYGFLDRSATTLNINYGFSWGMGGWLLTHFLQKAGMPKVMEMQTRVAAGLKTIFASHYAREISLREALSLDAINEYSKQTTGEKFLIRPQLD